MFSIYIKLISINKYIKVFQFFWWKLNRKKGGWLFISSHVIIHLLSSNKYNIIFFRRRFWTTSVKCGFCTSSSIQKILFISSIKIKMKRYIICLLFVQNLKCFSNLHSHRIFYAWPITSSSNILINISCNKLWYTFLS